MDSFTEKELREKIDRLDKSLRLKTQQIVRLGVAHEKILKTRTLSGAHKVSTKALKREGYL